MPGTEPLQRTLTRSELARRLRRQDDDAFAAHLRRLCQNHGLQFSRGPGATPMYDLEEFRTAELRHRGCNGDCVPNECTRGKLLVNKAAVRKPTVSQDSSITQRVLDFVRKQDKGKYHGTVSDLAAALRTSEGQIRESLARNISKGRMEKLEEGGWTVAKQYLPKEKKEEEAAEKAKPKQQAGPSQLRNRDGTPTKAAQLIELINSKGQPCVMTMADVGEALGVKSSRAQNLASLMRRNGLIRTERVKGDKSKLTWEVVKDLGQS